MAVPSAGKIYASSLPSQYDPLHGHAHSMYIMLPAHPVGISLPISEQTVLSLVAEVVHIVIRFLSFLQSLVDSKHYK